MTDSTQGVDSISQKNDQIKDDVQPSGIRWVAVYSILTAIGYGQYGVALLIKNADIGSLIIGTILSVLFFLLIATIYGLLSSKFWSYKLAKALYLFLIGFELLRLLLDLSTANIVSQGIAVVFSIWIFLYLRNNKLKNWFEL